MTADEFAELVRKADIRLRVDRVVVRAGKLHFRGSGTLRIVGDKFEMDVALSRTSKAAPHGEGVWREADFWKLKAIVEHALPITATHVSPRNHSSFGNLTRMTLGFGAVRLPGSPRMSAKKRKEALRLLDELCKKHAHSQQSPVIERKPELKPTLARFVAVVANYKLPASNAATTTVRKNPFFKKNAESWAADTLLMRGSNYEVALIQRGEDLQIHFRSKGKYKSRSAGEDAALFQAVLDSIGFCYGFNPWPQRRQQWREERQVLDLVSVPQRLPRTIYAPFDEGLGQSSPPPILLITRFFNKRSPLSRKISEFLFLFRQAGDEPVHFPVQTLAFCSLFEGLVHSLFDELKLEGKIHRSDVSFAAFTAGRDRLVTDLRARGKAGDEVSARLAGLVSNADAFRVKDKFKAVCASLALDYAKMKPHFDAWYEERNPLMHGTWRSGHADDFANQASIAAAINILLLKVMGYRGRVVAMLFGPEKYRDI